MANEFNQNQKPGKTALDAFAGLLLSSGQEIGKQQLINLVRRAVRLLKVRFPKIAVDTMPEKVFWFLEPGIRGAFVKLLPPTWGEIVNGVMEEINSEVVDETSDAPSVPKNTTPSSTSPSSGGKVTVMKNMWLCSSKDPAYVVLDRCSVGHHLDEATGKVKPEFRQISIEDILLSGKGAVVPVVGCYCAKVLSAEIDEIKAAQAPKAPPPPKASEGKVSPVSLTDFIGQAYKTGDAAIVAKTNRLKVLIRDAKFSPKEYYCLENCDTANEFYALLECDSVDQLRAILPMLRTKAERGLVGSLGDEAKLMLGQVGDVWDKTKKSAGEFNSRHTERLQVVKLCTELDVTRSEVFSALNNQGIGVVSENLITLTMVRFAVATPSAGGDSPVEAYRKKQKPQTQTKRGFGSWIMRNVIGIGE